jgi:hypothetical protein
MTGWVGVCVVTPVSAGPTLLSTTMVVKITNLLLIHGLIPITDKSCKWCDVYKRLHT